MLSRGAPAPLTHGISIVQAFHSAKTPRGGQQRYTSRTTPHVTCVTRHAQNAKPTSRCRTVAPWSTTMRRVFHPETNGVKASPHRHKRVLSHGAPADPSDPWNNHAAPETRS